ncbi:hypothetical protein pdam_00006166 [Pocillopora damicornis]|uniref:G-protein coupled receptors family 1 profile domain-containing protein n=1 Tax=Pocillopora damicornis TaxID=46731 RepID=A0A3M6UTL3_POCDA|nr:hypothetical protein pdam_00006166 [Pocillopora damicornis]
MTKDAAFTILPSYNNISTTRVPPDQIKTDICQKILYENVNGSHIRILDVILLIPNILFLMFLMYRLGVAHVQLSKIRCPIVKTVYFMVFFVCIIGTARCFVSMLLTSILKLHHKDSLPTKILWIILRCFLLAVEVSVIIFAVWAGMDKSQLLKDVNYHKLCLPLGNMQDGRKGVRRVLGLSLFCAVAYSSTQATLEFVKCPGINGRIFGSEKYDFYGHGGLLFLSSTSLFLALVYLTILILPCTKLREWFVLPGRKSFYLYCAVMCVVNLMQGSASLLMYESFVQSLCAYTHVLTVDNEYASYSYSYLPTEDVGDGYVSSDFD